GLGWRLRLRGSSGLQRLAHPRALPQERKVGVMLSGQLRLEMNISGTTTYTKPRAISLDFCAAVPQTRAIPVSRP
ncbi:hypothetical protein, partial [Rhodoferax sp.]|uniref:hypothetical protein n=1 Tax=Rhodoferax sp. TaxID=50421 RepID=UPI0027300BB9